VFDYCDFSPKQLEVIEAPLDARITLLEGAVRSGKTIASIIRWALYVLGETSPNAKLLMLGVTGDTLYRNVVSDLLDIVGTENARYVDHTLHLFGRTVTCVGARDVGAEKRIRGMTVEGCYIDEVTQIPEVVVKQAILRCSKGLGRLIWTTNPDSPFHWVCTDYAQNAKQLASGQVAVYHFTLDDNFALSADYKDYIKSTFTGLWYQRMVLGLWVLSEGVIYDHFDLETHGYDDGADGPPAIARRRVVCDYGTQNPFHALDIRSVGQDSWVDNEMRYSGRDTKIQKTDADYSADLVVFVGGDLDVEIITDPSAASFKAQLKRDGFTRIRDAKNDVLPGILTVSSRLKQGKLKVHRTRCPDLVKEFGLYAWDPKAAMRGEDAPLKVNDHGMDALRYHEFTIHGGPDMVAIASSSETILDLDEMTMDELFS
jgi:PBSX family phage terminase large subunit